MIRKFLAAAMAAIATSAIGALPDDYTVIELFPGATFGSGANAVSNNGIVVGCYGGQQTAFMWKDGQRTDLWNGGCATGVNDNGVVVGYDSAGNVVMWNSGTLTQLGFQSYGAHVNNAGWVVGANAAYVGNTYVQHSYLYHDGQLIEMPVGCHEDINNLDQVLCNTQSGAGIWQDSTITPLPRRRATSTTAGPTFRAPAPSPTARRSSAMRVAPSTTRTASPIASSS